MSEMQTGMNPLLLVLSLADIFSQLLLKSIQVVQMISVVGCLNIKKISFYKHDFWEIIGFETEKGTEVVVKSDF